MKILYSPKSAGYSSTGHPERPERVTRSYEFLKDKLPFIEPKPCEEKDVLLVHTRGLLESVRKGTAELFDGETPNLPGIFDMALLSAGSASGAAKLALKKEKAFSLMRPPGHHAGRAFLGGFCYFNNMAIAIQKSLSKADKAAIIDIDVHHGNGSQDIVLGNNKVLYVSLHQSPLYPGTGLIPEKNCLNYPLPAGTVEQEYLKVLGKALEQVKKFSPDLIGVSAGFDTYKLCPIAGLSLEIKSYYKIGRMIRDLNIPAFAILEGGYSQDLPQCIYEFIRGIG
ncbi:MAG: histone deacetylase [Candidatus Aenigmarchaeota archaeon]|nr:histone deacetylase [Candidatus Aenigmarchaeota archaeon]